MIEKRFLSGEERVFSRRQARGWRRKAKFQMSTFKIHMADEGVQTTSTNHTDTYHDHKLYGHER